MYIAFEMYRSKNPDEMFDCGKIQVDINTEEQLIRIDEVVLRVLSNYECSLPLIKKYGTAYLGRLKILNIEITDADTAIDLDEVAFNHYMSTIIPNLEIIWSKSGTISNDNISQDIS